MKIAIIGAGWAGLSAAITAADLGHDVTVFEASHTLGGRARAVFSPRLQTGIDNGQHIMLGAYGDTLSLMQRLGVDAQYALQRLPLKLESADATFRISVPPLPAPLHLLAALLTVQGVSYGDKWRLALTMHRLRRHKWQVTPSTTVQQWLDTQHQSAKIKKSFWQPLCVAALNTPIKDACAQLFANVLRDALGGARHTSDLLLPRVDLSHLWPDHVEQISPQNRSGQIRIRRGTVVRQLVLDSAQADSSITSIHHAQISQNVIVNDERFDAAIIACNVPSTRRLLASLPVTQTDTEAVQCLLSTLNAFNYIPIATLTLRLAQRWNLPDAMYLLHENRAIGHYGQWLFNCPAFMQTAHKDNTDNTETADPASPILAQIVISDAHAALAEDEATLVSGIQAQLQAQTRRFGTMPAVTGHELIAEKRATFAATPELKRPGAATPWPSIWLAGDWTDTGYPAVLEGAVRSGQQAATALHRAIRQHVP